MSKSVAAKLRRNAFLPLVAIVDVVCEVRVVELHHCTPIQMEAYPMRRFACLRVACSPDRD